MNNIFGLLFVIIFGGAGLLSILIVINLLSPGPVEETQRGLETSLGRSFLLGLINFLWVAVLDVLMIWLAQLANSLKVISGILVIVGGLITLILAVLAFLGLASLANLLGHRMGGSNNEFGVTLRGGILLLLAGFTPFVGWFAFAPLMVLTALGAAIRTVLHGQPRAASKEP
ncbi:MAG TPA: hypothetical protein VLZ89_16455 [Anaerolineales bacterium]|nr:hypothetical protein [Anaerolineales bacterium]